MAADRAAEIEAELDALADNSVDQLKARWLELKGIALPKFMRRELMTRAVAHAIQETALGGLDPDTAKRLDELVRQIVPKGQIPPAAARKRIKAGTRILREWQGQVHEVTVAADGTFLWRNERHRSLSAIARQMTGTRWNGWTFFGLAKAPGAKRADPGRAGPAEPRLGQVAKAERDRAYA